MKKIFYTFSITFIFMVLLGCTNHKPNYSANAIGQISQVKQGKIINIKQVNIRGQSNIGTQIGGVAGGIGGAFVGNNSIITNIAGSIGGAIVGGIIGGITEKALTSSKGYQFTVRLTNGNKIAILQNSNKNLSVGSEVSILISGNNARIIAI